ncbi:MAG: Pr6Pr family membrane protein [Betaproteobacteria bacterium]|nr:Pr6Pr family membrane protein [Betaproteobacteria bacterium]
MTNRSLLTLLRLLLGLIALIAIFSQLVIQIHNGFSILNFFSYFTNLSNLFAAAVLLYVASRVFFRRDTSDLSDQVRYISVVNMAVVGVVFTVLLRGVDLGSLLPWINVLLHYVMPCAVVLDWLLQPPRVKLGIKQILMCQVFPALYLVYVLCRGHNIGWYPYPFLNPANVGGYGGVAMYVAGIAVAFFFASWLLLTVGNTLSRRAAVAHH